MEIWCGDAALSPLSSSVPAPKDLIGRDPDNENSWLAEFQPHKNLIGRKHDIGNPWLIDFSAWKNVIGLDLGI